MVLKPFESAALGLYQLAWSLTIPFLRYNQRLAEGYSLRCLNQAHLKKADLWIQSASAGEAYLAWEILKRLCNQIDVNILLTTNTSQGMGILQHAAADLDTYCDHTKLQLSYFPFDSPAIMRKAIRCVQPSLSVMLETELWPGFLVNIKKTGGSTLLLNGRLTQRSLRHYKMWPSFWRALKPEQIMAISTQDRDRFAELFGNSGVSIMPNIKFDRFTPDNSADGSKIEFRSYLSGTKKLIILGSVRKDEEDLVEKIIQHVLKRQPDTIIGLFPRHMHRIELWQQRLQRSGISWVNRSSKHAPHGGGVILWDVFGELGSAYSFATAAFVGGSLVDLGGQNFLEPLAKGAPTIIGPYWDNFKWVGTEILDQGILRKGSTWKEVAEFLVARIISPLNRDSICRKMSIYLESRQGGTDLACEAIKNHLII